MWPSQSHTLQPLTRLTPTKRKFKLTQVEQNHFDEIKALVAQNTLLIYPDFK